MKDSNIITSVDMIQYRIAEINEIIADLHTKNVEIRISYTDAKEGNPAYIKLWKATEHNDYIEDSI